MSVKEMFKEAELGLARYRNIIGIGVIVFFLVFGFTFAYTYMQEKKIAEKCGFIDEKIKCVCTKDAWQEYQFNEEMKLGESKHLNISTYSDNYNG